MSQVAIMLPQLPSADRLRPYLESIDQSRLYSNFGPLVVSLEDRTLGLAVAIAVQEPQPGSLCVMPAWTFVASAHAATMAGLIPFFIDVDPKTWALDPGKVLDQIKDAPAPIGAVMPVMPFGLPMDLTEWDAFRARSGLAVVIDAAAGFDSLVPSAVPAVVSLHATKALGTGEGGFVISTDPAIRRAVRMRSNFGFDGTRHAQATAFNAKLSEYHAAVGLAALDEWNETRAEWYEVADAYRRAFRGSNDIALQHGFGETWISSTCVLSFARSASAHIEQILTSHGIETRRWWGAGAHVHPATQSFPRTAVPATEALALSTLALPFYRGLGAAEISRVADIVLAIAAERQPAG
jgi:dTDP-4-amino-4,6-dideoxygalactose transaminase